jgi:predicted nuclease with TOPRIM domain
MIDRIIDVITSPEVIVALLAGGVLREVIGTFSTRAGRVLGNRLKKVEEHQAKVDLETSEKDSLREDIKHLRGEISLLRQQIETMKSDMTRKEESRHYWQRRYWMTRAEADRLTQFLLMIREERTAKQARELLEDLKRDNEQYEYDDAREVLMKHAPIALPDDSTT